MNAALYRRLADQCRKLMARAVTEAAREQLRLWVAEFEAEAEATEFHEFRNPERRE